MHLPAGLAVHGCQLKLFFLHASRSFFRSGEVSHRQQFLVCILQGFPKALKNLPSKQCRAALSAKRHQPRPRLLSYQYRQHGTMFSRVSMLRSLIVNRPPRMCLSSCGLRSGPRKRVHVKRHASALFVWGTRSRLFRVQTWCTVNHCRKKESGVHCAKRPQNACQYHPTVIM